MRTILDIFMLTLPPHVQFLAAGVRVATDIVEIKCEALLDGHDLLHGCDRAPACSDHISTDITQRSAKVRTSTVAESFAAGGGCSQRRAI